MQSCRANGTPVQHLGTPVMGVIVMGCESAVRDWKLRSSVYQMNHFEGQVLDEGNCHWATTGGKEACEDMRKRRVCISPPGHLHVKAARLRTETSYKAGSIRRVSTTSRSRSSTVDQVNEELVQRSITLLSGEVCIGGMRAVVAPTNKACLKTRNESAQAISGGAELSRGHSTELPRPTGTGRTER